MTEKEELQNDNTLSQIEGYTETAEVMTKSGWKSIRDLEEGEMIVTLNTNTLQMEFKPITALHVREHDGIIAHVQSKKIDDYLTIGCSYPIMTNRKKRFDKYIQARDVVEMKVTDLAHRFIATNADAYGYITLDKIPLRGRKFVAQVEKYQGKIYAIEVENNIWYVKQNGFAHWASTLQ